MECLLSGVISEGDLKDIYVGPGDDGAVVLRGDMAIVKTVDVFTPIVDDPYIQGKIAACNSTSDIYAMGVLDITGVLVIMGIPENLPLEISREMLKGFQDFCREEGTSVIGGHTILNPWPLIGGAVIGVGRKEEIVTKGGAREGDRIVLTKPLGTQTAMALSRVEPEYLSLIEMEEREREWIVNKAIELMTLSNRRGLLALRELEREVGKRVCHAMTDITGFGILGHGNEMARESKVEIEIHTLPVIKGTERLAPLFGHPLLEGYGAETAGGLFMSVEGEYVEDLIEKLRKYGCYGFEVGEVKRSGVGKAYLSKDVKIVGVK